MKYTTQIDINQPIDRVIELFDNPDNMKEWMEGLQSFESISGTPGEEGAQSKLKFQMGKRSIEMIETITTRNLPEEFTGTYETKGVFNIVKNRFVPIDEHNTRYIQDQEFQFRSLTMKVMGFIMPSLFKKQSMKYLTDFKNFAEGQK